QAGAASDGYLSQVDWGTFNNKVSSTSLSGASVISYTSSSGVITTQGGTFGAGNYVFPSALTVNGPTTLGGLTILNQATSSLLAATSTIYVGSTATTTILGNGATSTFAGGVTATGLASSNGVTVTGGTILQTNTATDTLSSVSAAGLAASNGLTLTGGSLLITSGATTTANNGINVTAGCLAVNGSCVATRTSFSASAPLAYNSSTGAFSITQAGAASDGYLSQVDWGTFNNKVSSTSLSGASVISYTSSSGVITTQGGTFGAGNYVFPSALTVNGPTTLGGLTILNQATSSLLAATSTIYVGSTATTTILGNGATSTFAGGVTATGLASSNGVTVTGGTILQTNTATDTLSSVSAAGLAASNGLTLTGGSLLITSGATTT